MKILTQLSGNKKNKLILNQHQKLKKRRRIQLHLERLKEIKTSSETKYQRRDR